MVLSSAPWALALTIATSTATAAVVWIIAADHGAMVHGAKTLKIGAVGCGADSKGPETENVLPGVYL